ncbi:hypothetical protein VNO77_15289 [Canavalia gladiata]|uniref:Uncharacterized protein n=1 Tax=Canavalia gladiata TaxID=3824 RepID=A0AAN9QP46_CANGL
MEEEARKKGTEKTERKRRERFLAGGFLGKLGLKFVLLSIGERSRGEKRRGKKLVSLEIAPNRKSFHHALHHPVKPPLIEEGIGPSYSLVLPNLCTSSCSNALHTFCS